MLQIAGDDGIDVESLAVAWDLGDEGAVATQTELHLDPRLAGLVELLHHTLVDDMVQLESDQPLTSAAREADLAVDELVELAAQLVRCYQ